MNDTDRRVQKNGFTDDHYERRQDDYMTIPANTPELKKIFFQLRYIAYCEEHPEFKETHNLDMTETDDFDLHSEHHLLMYKPLHMFVGGARMVLPQPNKAFFGLPSVALENSPFQKDFPHDLSQMVELSRFLISRNRMKMIRSLQKEEESHEYPTFALSSMHLILPAFRICQQSQYIGLIATLEPSLIRMTRMFMGMWTPHGSIIDYHGKRQPSYMIINDYLKHAKENDLKNYHFFRS